MPVILNGPSGSVTIAGLTSSTQVHHFLIGSLSILGFLVMSYIVLLSVPRLARWGPLKKSGVSIEIAKPRVRLTQLAAAYLRPNVSLLESPFTPRPNVGPVTTPPKAHTMRDVYRYPGNCWNGEHTTGPKASSSPKVKTRSIYRHQVSAIAREVVQQVDSLQPAATAFSPQELMALWESTVHMHEVADDVVGTHPDALPLAERLAPVAPQSFPWVSSSGVGADFKFGLVHTIDTAPASTPAPVPPAPAPASASPVQTQLPPSTSSDFHTVYHTKWGKVTHTLALPLRGNKIQPQRAPFVLSTKHNVTTNAVFSKTSPFYTPSAAGKENVGYPSMEDVCALV
ncbi:hypothetical protein DFH07DRAFT_772593 [Mycena maculata]|uniref:Uncharacterized protein n=1 Tax=Mycena maculata TaxID=230809 RepID=A0AAD7J6D5_9AGAR|nr:hypothetical protein DFH07DRAFT_772593 [Mycena maculata]